MICRRCGMESATTDVCEWCKKPMLPEGGTISARAKEQLLQERAQAAQQPPQPEAEPEPEAPRPAAEGEMPPARPGLKPPSQPEVHESGLLSLGAHLDAGEEEATPPSFVTREVEPDENVLRPLGPTVTSQSDGSGDLSAETARYIGNDQSIFRPIERPQAQGSSQWTVDPATGRRRRVTNDEPEIPDNVRLRRAAPRGAIVAFVLALAEFLIFRSVPGSIATLPLPGLASSSTPSIVNAVAYGFYCSILLGFMLAALLVNRKWGPAQGFFIGLIIGYGTLGNGQSGRIAVASLAAGAIAGILVGKVAAKGVKKIVSV